MQCKHNQLRQILRYMYHAKGAGYMGVEKRVWKRQQSPLGVVTRTLAFINVLARSRKSVPLPEISKSIAPSMLGKLQPSSL